MINSSLIDAGWSVLSCPVQTDDRLHQIYHTKNIKGKLVKKYIEGKRIRICLFGLLDLA